MAEFKLGRLRFVWKGVWTTGTQYFRDDIVRYGGSSYVCLAGHTAQTNFNADLTFNNSVNPRWQLMTAGQSFKSSPWTASTVYAFGEIVRYGGKTYICVLNHTADSTQNGGFYNDLSTKWQLFSDGEQWKGNWATSTYYKLGDIVKYNGNNYICNTGHTSAATAALGLESDLSKWDTKIEGFKWRDTWTVTTRYIRNDVVKYGANLWLCTTPHTSGSSFVESNWTLFVSGLEFEDNWNASKVYQEGDVVTYGGYSYISKQLHSNKVPPLESNYWGLLTTGYNQRGRYSELNTYKVGDVVQYGGQSYVAVNEVSAAQTPTSNPLKWQLVTDGIRWLGEWDNNPGEATYKIGDAVSYGPTSYICVKEHTPTSLNRPDLDLVGTNWNVLSEGSETNVLFRRGDLVTRSGIQNVRLPKGAKNEFLSVGEFDLEYKAVGATENVFYVTPEGSDTNSGTNLNDAWATIKHGMDYIRTVVKPTNNKVVTLRVMSGVYTEVFPIIIPAFTSMVGDELRASIVQPTEETSHLDKFLVRDCTTIRNFTWRGATGKPGTNGFEDANQYGTKRPNGGAWVALDPGTGPTDETVWISTRSPYVQNVSTLGINCLGTKIDGSLHNGGNRSLTCNDYTQLMSDSIGFWCTNNGRAELVSVFTYYSYIGYLCDNGGIIRATNGNNSYGTYGAVAEGVDPTEISRYAQVDNRRLQAIVDRVQTNGDAVLYLEYLAAGEEYTNADYQFLGAGSNNVIANETIYDGGVTQIQVIDDGNGYTATTNNAQDGTNQKIRISTGDTAVNNAYNGMRVILTDGLGAGQYGIVANFDGGAKELKVLVESFEPITIISSSSTGNVVNISVPDSVILGNYIDSPFLFQGAGFGVLNTTTVYYIKTVNNGTFTFYSDPVTKTAVTLTDSVAAEPTFLHIVGWEVVTEPKVFNISAITKENPVKVTTTTQHGLAAGFAVYFQNVGGMVQLNNNVYYVKRVAGQNGQFTLYSDPQLLNAVNGTGFTTYTTGGTVTGFQPIAPLLDSTTRYYIEPRVVFSTGKGATATAERSEGVDAVAVLSGGRGFTIAPEIFIAGSDTRTPNQTATATTTITGSVEEVVVYNKGTGYTVAPTLAFTGGGLPTGLVEWAPSIALKLDDNIITDELKIYNVTLAGVTGTSKPTLVAGTILNGTAELEYVGQHATASATVTRTIKTITLTEGGTGYSAPPSVSITGTGGSGAIVSSTISQVIGSIDIQDGGTKYTQAPTISIVGGDPKVFATATAQISAQLFAITVLEGGDGYNPNNTTVTIVGDGTGQATATPVIDFGNYQQGVTRGVITGFNITDPGSGYKTPPTVIISTTGAGRGASAQAIISGSVSQITVTNKGKGYQAIPTVVISGGGQLAGGLPASATANKTGAVDTLTVIDGGRGWVGTPAVNFSGTSTSTAAATVTALDFVINNVVVTSPGDNYTSNPALAVKGTGTGAILRPRINGTVNTVTVTDPGSWYGTAWVVGFVGGNVYKSSTAGLRYYANASARIAIGPNQFSQTLAGINRAKVVAKAVAANTNPGTRYQTAINRTSAQAGYSAPSGIANAIEFWMNAIYYTIENGENSVNAAEIISLNREFIKNETYNFLDVNGGGLADEIWNRDFGIIVDVIARDISTKGLDNTLTAATSQVLLYARTPSSPEQSVALDVLDFMKDLLRNVSQNIVVTPTLGLIYTWRSTWSANTAYVTNDVVFANNGTYICQVNHTANNTFLVDLDLGRWELKDDGQKALNKTFELNSSTAIGNCVNVLKAAVSTDLGKIQYSTAANLLKTNKPFIIAETIAFINNTYLDFVYNQALCGRDVGFIIDAIAYDLIHATVDAEPETTVSTTGVINAVNITNGGEGYSPGLTVTFTGGGTPTTTAVAKPIIDKLTGEITGFTMTNKGRGYDATPITVSIIPDTGTGALARCRLAGSNVSRITVIKPGSGYSAGPFMKLVDPLNTIDAEFKVNIGDGVLGQPSWGNRGQNWLNADARVSGDGYAELAQTGNYVFVKQLTNEPVSGANVQFEDNEIIYRLVNVRELTGPAGIVGARQILLDNKIFIQEEIQSYLNNFTYNQALCERDMGLILDGFAEDLIYNGNFQLLYSQHQYTRGIYSVFQNQRVQTGYAVGYLQELLGTSQKPATLGSLRTLAEEVGAAVVASAGAVAASQDLIDIVYKMLDKGEGAAPTIVRPDPSGLDNGIKSGRALLLSNRNFIKAELIAQIDAENPVFVYDKVKCARDVGLILDAVLGDLVLNSTHLSTYAGISYLRSYSNTVLASQKAQTIAGINKARDLCIAALSGSPTLATTSPIITSLFAIVTGIINAGTPPGGSITYTAPTGVSTDVSKGFAILRANKQFLIDEIIGFIDENLNPGSIPGYDETTCARDLGYIVDALSFDLYYGGNFQSIQAGLSYYIGFISTIAAEKDQNVQAQTQLKLVLSQIITNSTSWTLKSTTNTTPQVTNLPAAISSGDTATSLSNNQQAIIDIINSGPNSAPSIVYPTWANGARNNLAGDRTTVLLAKTNIQNDTIAYLDTTYPPGFTYDRNICKRDVDYIIDAIAYDITYTGNIQSVIAGRAYYSYTELQIAAPEKPAIISAFQYLSSIIPNIMQDLAVTSPYQNSVQQVRAQAPATGGTLASANFVQNRLTDIINIINGNSVTNIDYNLSGVASDLLIARSNLSSAKSAIQATVLAYIDDKFPTLVFNRATCSRDLGYIMDAVGWDFCFGSNFNSIVAGRSYSRAGAQNLITGISSYASRIDFLTEWLKNGETYYSLPALSMPNGPANAPLNKAKNILLANEDYLASNALYYFIATYSSVTISNTALFRNDIKWIIRAIAHDLTYSGNLATMNYASAYYSGSPLTLYFPGYTTTAASVIKSNYLGMLTYLVGKMNDAIVNTAVPKLGGLNNPYSQDLSLDPADNTAQAIVTARMNEFSAIINLGPGTIGVTIGQKVNNSYSGYPGVLTGTRQAVIDSKDNLLAAITDWMNEQWVLFTYNNAVCYRDTGLIVQAIADDVYGDTNHAIEAGQRYFAATAKLVLKLQGPQTIAAIDRINFIAQKVIRNQEYTRTQNNAFQSRTPSVTNGAQAGPAMETSANIIKRILETGFFVNKVKQVMLDNKEFIKAEVIAFINASYEALDYNQALCARDVGFLIDAFAYDIYGGFSRSREAGLRYYSSASALKAITGDQKEPTLAGIRHLREVLLKVLVNQDPAISFQNVQQRVVPQLQYDKATCFRDVGLIVDAIAYDMALGSNFASIIAGRSYYRSGADLVIAAQKEATIAAYEFLKELLIEELAGNPVAIASARDNMNIILNLLEGGVETIPEYTLTDPTGYDSGFKNGRNLLRSNKDFIAAEVIQYLTNNFPAIEYSKTTCARDVKYLVDAMVYDLTYGGDYQTTIAANAYYSFNVLQIDVNDKVATQAAYTHVASIASDIMKNIAITALQTDFSQVRGTAGSSASATAMTDLVQIVIDVLDDGVKEETTYPLISWADAGLIVKKRTLDDDKLVIQEKVTKFVDINYAYDTTLLAKYKLDEKISDQVDACIAIIVGGPLAMPPGRYTARLQLSPPMAANLSPAHDSPTIVRNQYSQVRMTGHDFLNIGVGNKADTNYPGIPVNPTNQANEVYEAGGGRVFYTSTDQDGNFRVGDLFRVEQSTGIATLNADAFNLSGLNELSLGGLVVGGTNAVIREFSTDPTFFANSDNVVPTQKAIRTYIATALSSGGGNLSVNAITAGGVAFLSADELTTIGNVPFRFTSTGGYKVQSGVASTDINTGSLTVVGGVGISGNLNVGGTITGVTSISAQSIQGTPIGTSASAAASFTDLSANGVVSFTANTASNSPTTGAVLITGGLGVGGNLNVAGSFNVAALAANNIDGTPIGSTTRASGAFTTLAANGQVSFTAGTASTTTGTGTVVVTGGVGISGALFVGGAISQTANANITLSPSGTGVVAISPTGTASTVTISPTGTGSGVTISPAGTGSVVINPTSVGSIDRMNVGATTRGSGAFTTLAANNAITLTAGANNASLTTTGAGILTISSGTTGNIDGMNIGATTRGSGAFTTLAANSTVTLSPAAAGVTISPTGAGGTVTISPAVTGSISNVTGSFTTLTATGAITLNTTSNNQSITTTGSATITISSGGIGNIDNMTIGGTTPAAATVTQLITPTTGISSAAWTTSGVNHRLQSRTYTDTSSTAGTVSASYINSFQTPTFASTNVITITDAANLFLAAPATGSNTSITNAWSLLAGGRIKAQSIEGTPIGTQSGQSSTAVFTQLTVSGANLNTAISPTGTSTVTISPAGQLTLGTATVTTSLLGNISAAGSGQTFSFAPTGSGGTFTVNPTAANVSISTTTSGTISITGSAGLTLGTAGQTTTMAGNISATTSNQTVTLSPTGTGTVTIAPAGAISITGSAGLTLGTAGQTTTMNGNISATTSNQTVTLSPTGTGTVAISPASTVTINPAGSVTISTSGSNNNVSITPNGTGVTSVKQLSLQAATGTTAGTAPMKFASNTNLLATVEAGAVEYDNVMMYLTSETTSGRKMVAADHHFHLSSGDGTTITATTISDAFAAGSISLQAGVYYEIEWHMFWARTTTAGLHTYTMTASSAPTFMVIGGINLITPGTIGQMNFSSAATTVALAASNSMAIGNHYHVVKGWVLTNAATTIRLQVTSSANGITLKRGSHIKARRVPAGNIGTWA